MSHKLDIDAATGTFRLDVDLDDASLDDTLDPTAARYMTLKNVLLHLPGPLRKRGSCKAATADFSQGVEPMAAWDGTLRSSTTYRPYYGVWSGANAGAIDNGAMVTVAGSALSSLGMNGSYLYQRGWPAQVSQDVMVFCSKSAAIVMGGTVHTEVSGAAAVFTTGSTAVTGLASMTSSMIGSFIVNSQDSNVTQSVYQIVAVPSSTTCTIDRKYSGSRSATASNWRARAVDNLLVTTGIFNSSGSVNRVCAGTCASMWGRLVVGDTTEDTVAGITGVVFPHRIRWSGIAGTIEPYTTTPTDSFYGLYGFNANGYLDLPQQYGQVQSLVPHGNTLVCLQERGVTFLYGAPTASSAGSLNAEMTFRSTGRYLSRGAVSTPYGVFLLDTVAGLMHWDGHGAPKPLGVLRNAAQPTLLGQLELGYYGDYVIVGMSGSSGSPRTFMYHVPSRRLVEVSSGGVALGMSYMQRGRSDGTASTGDHYLVASNGASVLNVSNMIEHPGDAATDAPGGAVTVDIKTGAVGGMNLLLRPTRVYVTYRATDLTTTNPRCDLTITTGLPDTIDSAHSFTTASTDLVETTDVETKVIEITTIDRDPMVQVRALQTNNAGKFDIYSIIVEGSFEGAGVSS